MSALTQYSSQIIKRSISYNDLKKKRMLRSASNKGKLSILHHQMKDHVESNQNTLPDQHQKPVKVTNFLHKLPSITKQIEIKNDKNIRDSSHKQNIYTQVINNSNSNTQVKTQACKKIKSMRILAKASTKNLALTTKINPNIEKRIDKNDVLDHLKQKYSTQNVIDKKRKDFNSTLVLQNKHQKQKQNIFFNSISPIQQKNLKRSQSRIQQTSGFSILFQISQPKQTQAPLDSLFRGKLRLAESDSTQYFQRIQLPQHEIKMPKMVKKHLPKDFFLRV